MSLIVIVISLIAERFLLEHQHLREFRWLSGYQRWLQTNKPPVWITQGAPGLLVLLLPPALLTGLLQYLLSNSLFGLPSFIFGGLVLLYTLGPQDLDSQIDRYTQAAETEQENDLAEIARTITGEEPSPSEPARSQGVAEGALQQANQRLFAVLFWFLLLGPLGAMFYRIARQLPRLEQANRDIDFALHAKQLLMILDWLPARLTAICYAIAGSFEDALYGWRSYQDRRYDEFSDSNSGTLICAGGGAMRLTTLLSEEREELSDYSHLPQAAMALVWRSLVVWLIIAGLLTLTGLLIWTEMSNSIVLE
ncbi:MAG: regulatory signaling modulator protein AmpE [Candidatus Thiodiazotropha sp.]